MVVNGYIYICQCGKTLYLNMNLGLNTKDVSNIKVWLGRIWFGHQVKHLILNNEYRV